MKGLLVIYTSKYLYNIIKPYTMSKYRGRDFMKNYIVFDVGGTSVKYAIMNSNSRFLERGSYPSCTEDFNIFMNHMAKVIEDYKQKYAIAGIALSCPGGVDSETGLIGGASALPCIHGPNFKEILLKETGLKAELENDANCAALGEVWIGAAKDNKDVLFVVCGTGIGGAVVKDKRIHKGANLHGGEFGYMIMDICEENGETVFKNWSDVGSTIALVRTAAKLKNIEVSSIDGKKVFEMAEQGDKDCLEAISKFYFNFAKGIFNIQYMYDPEKIIIGGAISIREDFIERINEKLDFIMSSIEIAKVRPIIQKCEFNNDANLIGALYNYLQRQGEM